MTDSYHRTFLCTVAEAARLKGVSRQSIYNAIYQGWLSHAVRDDRIQVVCNVKFTQWLPDSKKRAAGLVAAARRKGRRGGGGSGVVEVASSTDGG